MSDASDPSDARDAAIHGGPNTAELSALGLRYDDVLDLSVSTNPYGPAPEMVDALRQVRLEWYPDPAATAAREAVSSWLDVSEQGVVIGNGAAELLWAVARTFVAGGERVLIVEPTFGEFRRACAARNAWIAEWRAREADGFAVDLEAVGAAASASGTKVVYLCSPNTPTGVATSIDAISAWAQRHTGITVVLDQSFLSLSEDYADRDVPVPGNVILIRSLTKDHSLPGLRVGYLVTTPRRATQIERQRPAWSASALAQAAVVTATQLDHFVAESRTRLLDDRRALTSDLVALGVKVFPSRTGYLIAQLRDVPRVRASLLRDHRVLVRDCASFGLPDFVRLGARPETDRARVIDALRRVLG